MAVIAAIIMFGTAALAVFAVYHAVPSLADAFWRNDRRALLRSSIMVCGAVSYFLLCLLLASW
jgi:hypothetical protein